MMDTSQQDALNGQTNHGMFRGKSKAMLHSGSTHGMARIKSSAKLFTVDRNIIPHSEVERELGGVLRQDKSFKSYDSENISDMSTGDSAYPVVAFNNR